MYKKIRKPLLIATICALVAFLILSIWAALANQILLTTIAGIYYPFCIDPADCFISRAEQAGLRIFAGRRFKEI